MFSFLSYVLGTPKFTVLYFKVVFEIFHNIFLKTWKIYKWKYTKFYDSYYIYIFCPPPLFLGPHLQHMEVPSIGVKSELKLPDYCSHSNMGPEPHLWPTHSSQQRRILNPLSEARDWMRFLTDISWVCYHWAMIGITYIPIFRRNYP